MVTQIDSVNIPTSCSLCHGFKNAASSGKFSDIHCTRELTAVCNGCLKNSQTQLYSFGTQYLESCLTMQATIRFPSVLRNTMWLGIQLPPLFSYCAYQFQLSQATYTGLSLRDVHCFCAVQNETRHQS